jgi:hypothetical protein
MSTTKPLNLDRVSCMRQAADPRCLPLLRAPLYGTRGSAGAAAARAGTAVVPGRRACPCAARVPTRWRRTQASCCVARAGGLCAGAPRAPRRGTRGHTAASREPPARCACPSAGPRATSATACSMCVPARPTPCASDSDALFVPIKAMGCIGGRQPSERAGSHASAP